MESPTQTPAGRAHGSGAQEGPFKAQTLEPSHLLMEGSKVTGGIAPKSPQNSPRGVHFPKDPKGGLGPMASDPNPQKQEPQMGTKHPAPLSGTQFFCPWELFFCRGLGGSVCK